MSENLTGGNGKINAGDDPFDLKGLRSFNSSYRFAPVA